MNRLFCAVLLVTLSTPVILHSQAKPPSQYQIQDDLDHLKGGPPAPGSTPAKPITDAERPDKIAALAAAGYNFRLLIRWLRLLLSQILIALTIEPELKSV